MTASCFVEMTQNREMAVDRVQQPEARDVGDPEVGEALILLPAHSSELRALRREDLDEASRDRHDVLARLDVGQGGDERRRQLMSTAGRSRYAGDANDGAPVRRFALEQNADVVARDLDRPLQFARR